MTNVTVKPEQLANEFSKILNEWLTEDEMYRVRTRNRFNPDDNICHSHDFCDANEAMAEALSKFGIEWSMEDWITDLWNNAWEIAKENQFKVK